MDNYDRYVNATAGVFFIIAKGKAKEDILKACKQFNVYKPKNEYKTYTFERSWIQTNPKNKGRTLVIPFNVACMYGIAQSMSGTSEIGGIGTISIKDDVITLNKIYCCYDGRNSSGAHFSNPEELSRTLIRARMDGAPADSLKAFWHSHPNFGTSPSVIDHSAIEKMIDENPKAEVYSIIFSNMRKASCRYDSKASGTYESEELNVVIQFPNESTHIVIDNPLELKQGTDKYLSVGGGYVNRFQGRYDIYDNDDFELDHWWEQEQKKSEEPKQLEGAKSSNLNGGKLLTNIFNRLESYACYYDANRDIVEAYASVLDALEAAFVAVRLIDDAEGRPVISSPLRDIFDKVDANVKMDTAIPYADANKLLDKLRVAVNQVNMSNYFYITREKESIKKLDSFIAQLIRLIIYITAEPEV